MQRLILPFLCLLLAVPCKADTIIVDQNGSGDFNNIQDAINYSWHGDTIVVLPGDYNEPFYFNNRAVTVTSVDPNDPNVVAATTISGRTGYECIIFDFLEDSNSVLTGFTLSNVKISCYGTSPTIMKNSMPQFRIQGYYGATPTISYNTAAGGIDDCHGTISYNTFENVNLDNCDGLISDNTIVQGNIWYCDGTVSNNLIVNTDFRYCDGHILNNTIRDATRGLQECNATISGNTIIDNSGAELGAGLYRCNGDITNNYIVGNHANGNNAKGGGLYQCTGNIAGNIIIANSASSNGQQGYSNYGGGLSECNGTIMNNIIAGNWAVRGGGLWLCSSGSIIINNTIVGNFAADTGGGMYGCNTTTRNNIIAFNESPNVGGIYGACQNNYNVFWGNGINFGGGAYGRTGDISVNPLFALDGHWDANDNWVDGDYHLKSEAGRWDPNGETWVTDDVTSLCIDVGDPNADWTAELWPHGKRINMGAYGGTAEASMSLSDTGNIADLSNDDKVDFVDFAYLADSWEIEEVLLREDLNRDGSVDFFDLWSFVDNWLWEQ